MLFLSVFLFYFYYFPVLFLSLLDWSMIKILNQIEYELVLGWEKTEDSI